MTALTFSVLCGGGGVLAAAAQQTTPPPGDGQQTKSQSKGAADNTQPQPDGGNAFPEDVSRKAAEGSAQASPPPSDAPQQESPKPSAAQDNPFPEDVSRKAAEAASSTSSSSGVSSSASGSPDIPDTEPDRHRLPKPSRHGGPGTLSGEAQAKEDNRIGSYYLGAGDWKGAYGRFVEAAQLDPANVDAVFGIAEAARHLGKAQEAAENYRLYLEIDPDGPRAKSARKALNTLSASK